MDVWDQFPDAQPQQAMQRQPDVWDQFPDAQPAAPQQQQRGGYLDKIGYQSQGLGNAPQPRFGDSLKSVFGGHNPIAETYDTVAPMLNPSSDRPLATRAMDAASFAINAPVRMVTQGQHGIDDAVKSVTGGNLSASRLAQGERDFAENNPAIMYGLETAGAIAPGVTRGLGMGAPRPQPVKGPQMLGPDRPQPNIPVDSVGKARQAAQDMTDLQIRQHGPAIAQAARGGEGVGALAKTIESLPIVGRPLQQGTQDFVSSAARAGDRIASEYSPSGNIQKAGQATREYFEGFKNERSTPRDAIERMDDAAVAELATRPPRELGSLKTAADARYESAWRKIPEWMRNGGAKQDKVRLMGDMPNTRKVVMDISNRNLDMVNEQRIGRRIGVAEETAAELPTRFKEGSIQKNVMPLRGGLIGRALEDISAGNWRGSLQTMRNLRSAIRRLDSKMPDKEGNTLDRADMSRLQQAIHADMNGMLDRMIAEADGRNYQSAAKSFREAKAGFQQADAFYRRYSESMEGIKRITGATKDEAAIQNIMQAAQNGTKGDMNMIVQIRRMAPDHVIDDIASSLINEMGRPTGSAGGAMQEAGFSAGRFATSWNNMNPTARRALFGHRPELAQSLEKFARVAQNMSDYEGLANKSRSGQHSLIGMAILAGPAAIAQNFMTGLAGAAGMYGVSQFMASPLYVNWLTRTMLIQQLGERGGARMRQHVQSLIRSVKADKTIDPDLAKAIITSAGQAASVQAGN